MIDEIKREKIRQKWNIKIYFMYIRLGLKKIRKSKIKMIIALLLVVALTIAMIVLLSNKPNYSPLFNNLNRVAETSRDFIIIMLYIITIFVALFLFGKPFGAKRMNDNLKRAGIVNHLGEAPLLLYKESVPNNKRVKVYEFLNAGVPVEVWQDKLTEIESALNIKISSFEEGNSSNIIKMYATKGTNTLNKMILWKDEYIRKNDFGFELVLGETVTGEQVTVNLKETPHCLFAGSTGSGKSVLLRLALMQCIKNGAEVIISDFKGGVDFPPIWHKKCKIITEKSVLINVLKEMVAELEDRKVILKQSGFPNIDVYNRNVCDSNRMCRIVFACDEVAELLDKSGLTKEQKTEIAEIESYLATIARQGRAFGIHLILVTQRPDSTIISGQIKNNIDYRACGRADIVLSEIILNNGDAHDRIPKNAQGRFLDNNGTLFQAYWFDENDW